jgi:formylglycine-generating enzyme required for sulfatase activity
LGNGAHLITNEEWTLLARDAESLASNWSGGSVGSGAMARGWAANTAYGDTWTNTAVASSTGSSCLYNTAADTCGSSGTFLYRRTLNLTNGNTIWDLCGNVWEWTHDICYLGTGTGYWYNSSWIEWNDSNVTDYEKLVAGPMSGSYAGSNGVGRYLGCTTNGNAFLRGGAWYDGSYAGAFALNLYTPPSYTNTNIGFRCAR